MASSYRLAAQNITTTTAEILVTEDFSPFNPASGVTVTLTNSGTTTQGTTDTNGVTTFTGLTPLTTYTASATNSGNITFTTLEDTTPKMATASQWQDLITAVKSKATITMTDTDPGEGSALAANNFVAVYDGDPIILDYSTSEVNTGVKWIDGSAIYKKTIYVNSLPNNTTMNIAHGISNLNGVVKLEGVINTAGTYRTLPFVSKNALADAIEISCDSTNIIITTGGNWSSSSAYVIVYYTKSS